MDAGDILAKQAMPIDPADTAVTLRAKMMGVGPALLLQTLDAIGANQCKSLEQDHGKATFAPKLTKELGEIRWSKKAVDINNAVRGLLPWPGAYTHYKGKLLKILEARIIDEKSAPHEPGCIVSKNKNNITVATGSQNLIITKVHLQDSKPMDVCAFLRGHELKVGYKFET